MAGLDLDCEPQALEAAATSLTGYAVGCRIVTSPACRALKLAKRLGASFAIEPLLRELDFGDWEGRLWNDIGRNAVETWQRGLPELHATERRNA